MATRTAQTATQPKSRRRRSENLPSPESIRQMLAELEAELRHLRGE